MKIELENVSFSYGKQIILENCNYSFEFGKILILLGRNGAGKSTLFDLITGNLLISSGAIKRDKIVDCGYMSDDFFYYQRFTIKEMCDLVANLREINSEDYRNSYQKYLQLLALDEFENQKISNLSFGTKQRVHLLLTLFHEPQEIYLDEPTNGLDPEQVYHFKTMIENLKNKNRLILISTHSLALAEDLADEIIVLSNQKLVSLPKTSHLEADYLALQNQ